jgi:hypothetical protein
MARCIASGISTSLISTLVTLMSRGSVCSSMILQTVVELVTIGQQVVQLSPVEHRPQSCLSDLGGGYRVLLHLGDGRAVRSNGFAG